MIGLHYGPSLDSKSGLVEQTQPVLMMRLPSFEKNEGINAFRQNARDSYVTAFDVHETILDVLLQTSSKNELGASIAKMLPKTKRNRCDTTIAIPQEFCSLIQRSNTIHGECKFMTDPPSVLSFYSDIPARNRPVWPDRCPLKNPVKSVQPRSKNCICATDTRERFDCSISRNHLDFPDSSYTLRSCGQHDRDSSVELGIHLSRNEQLIQAKKALSADSGRRLPNILFLEIDSVSLSYSTRHFPKTWSLLNQHKIVSSSDIISCPTGFCAAAFNRTSVVGQSSIVNQLAALSGCANEKDTALKSYNSSTYCYNGGNNSLTTTDHWIFDIAKRELICLTSV